MIVELNITFQLEKDITSCPTSGGYYYLDISPDGNTLAFLGRAKGDDNSGIYLIDLTKEEIIAERFSCSNSCNYKERDMAFSPDGKYLATTRRNNRFSENIYLTNLKNKEEKQITFSEEDIVGMSWHPKGDRLVFATQLADVRKGFVYELSSGEIKQLDVGAFSYPEFAKKEGSLFFQQRNEANHIVSLDLSNNIASSPFPLIQSEFSHHYPDFSAVANKLTYVSNESGYYELWMSDPDGKNRQKLTQLNKNIRYPKWSNNGKFIAFLAPNDAFNGEKIYVIDLNTRRIKLINSNFSRHNRPTWTPDDKNILTTIFSKEHTDLYKINLRTSQAERITFDNARYGVLQSDNTLVYSRIGGGLWLRDLSKNKESKMLIPPKHFRALYTWIKSENTVYYRYKGKEETTLFQYDLATTNRTPIFRFPYGAVGTSTNLTLIPEQDKIVFPHTALPQSDIKKLVHPLIN